MINYLIQVSLCLALSHLTYVLFLRHEKLLNLNRLYIVGTALLSFLIPLLPTPQTQSTSTLWVIPGEFISQVGTSMETTLADQKSWNVLLIIYFTGLALYLLLTVRKVVLIWLRKRNGITKEFGLVKYTMTPEGNASSFFQWIFVPEAQEKDRSALKTILIHEQSHCQALHSFDIILFELLTAILWFNPFIYWFKRSLKLQHEYIADEVVMRQMEKDKYEELLIRHSLSQIDMALVHAYGQAPIERRLYMIDKLNANTMKKLKLLLISPVLLLFITVVGFSQSQNYPQEVINESTDQQEVKKRPSKLNGKVTAADGLGLDKVTVKAMPSGNSTKTGTDGKYVLEMNESDTLINYSKKGYSEYDIPRARYSTINVQMVKKK